jgi:hypothetical protein
MPTVMLTNGLPHLLRGWLIRWLLQLMEQVVRPPIQLDDVTGQIPELVFQRGFIVPLRPEQVMPVCHKTHLLAVERAYIHKRNVQFNSTPNVRIKTTKKPP